MRNETKHISKSNVISRYHDDLKNCSPIRSKEVERGLLLKAKEGDINSRNKLVNSNLRFVFNTAKKYTGNGIPLEELISEGNMALLYAIDKYETNRDVRFITYASWWVRYFISDLVKKKYNRSLNEINEDCFDKDIRGINNIPEENTNKDNDLLHDTMKEQINENKLIDDLMEGLLPRERDVLESYYGLNGKKEMNLSELADKYGISKERIRQIKLSGLSKMRTEVLLMDDFENDLF